MDPDVAYAQIVQGIEAYRANPANPGRYTLDDLFDAWTDLDEWLKLGGFPPSQWRPRPRTAEEIRQGRHRAVRDSALAPWS